MAHRPPPPTPGDLRARLERARLDLLALFRTLDRMPLSPNEIPQRLLGQLFERDADYAEALWALAGVYCEWRHLKNPETSKPLFLNVMACGFSLQDCITP